jgi:nucleoside-diphosphate-sugar epimerase
VPAGHPGAWITPTRRHGQDRVVSGTYASILRNTALTDLDILEPAGCRTSRRLFSSSAYMYPAHHKRAGRDAGRGAGRLPANHQDAYGWKKPVSERLFQDHVDEFGMQTKVTRFHNS